jgi:2-iminoacetate synthase
MSAGSATEPGGYTGAGRDQLHLTRGGLPARDKDETLSPSAKATEQFHIADERSAAEVAHCLRGLGYEPVWKDWDAGILNPAGGR